MDRDGAEVPRIVPYTRDRARNRSYAAIYDFRTIHPPLDFYMLGLLVDSVSTPSQQITIWITTHDGCMGQSGAIIHPENMSGWNFNSGILTRGINTTHSICHVV